MKPAKMFAVAWLWSCSASWAAGLNDTGVTRCYDNASPTPNAVSCSPTVSGDTGTNPRQDAMYGRDAAQTKGTLSKAGNGAAGFDFTKIGADGNPLAIQYQSWSYGSFGPALVDNGSEASGTYWSCIQDNATGLTWEVKTRSISLSYPPSLREWDYSYTWYDPSPANGGNPGTANGVTTCGATCDTTGYASNVYSAGLCGHRDWRLPAIRELFSLVHFGASTAALIDGSSVPNTENSCYWSASTNAANVSQAYAVDFATGSITGLAKSGACRVRLVRGGTL